MTDASMREGESISGWGDRIAGETGLPAETRDAIVEFAEFLRYSHVHNLRPGEPVPPNVLRRFRGVFGLTHREIDQVEAALWRSEVARPETEAGR
jgi:hypothetical protein